MKKLSNIWDLILIAIMGMFGTGCILDPPPAPEYGVEPLYGVPAAYRTADGEQTEATRTGNPIK